MSNRTPARRDLLMRRLLSGALMGVVALAGGPLLAADGDESDLGFKRSSRTLRGASDAEHLPSIYMVNMKGQMGTDVNKQIYEEVKEDILAHDPDYIVIRMACEDIEDKLYSLKDDRDKSLAEFDDYRELIDLFKNELRDYNQVLWIDDAVGVASVVALAWENIYMTPDARLGNMSRLFDLTGADKWSDDDVRGKMIAAFKGIVKGYVEHGDQDLKLVDAMSQPQYKLSATWRGREVQWHLSDKGEYVVDGSEEDVTEFTAKQAEDFAVSDGTAETLDDLALLLGLREFRVLDGRGEEIIDDYVEDWRRAFDRCKTLMQDYQQNRSYAAGQDFLVYMGKARKNLEEIRSKMRRYRAVEMRMQSDFGISMLQIEIMIDQIKEDLKNGRGRAGRGGGSRGNGGGGATR